MKRYPADYNSQPAPTSALPVSRKYPSRTWRRPPPNCSGARRVRQAGTSPDSPSCYIHRGTAPPSFAPLPLCSWDCSSNTKRLRARPQSTRLSEKTSSVINCRGSGRGHYRQPVSRFTSSVKKPANAMYLECHGPNSPNGPIALVIEAPYASPGREFCGYLQRLREEGAIARGEKP